MTPSRYTRFVALSKHSLWVLIAIVIGIVLWIASGDSGSVGKRIVFTNAAPLTDASQNVMTKPYFQGLDENNRPYKVLADKATRIDEDHIALDNVRAEMTQANGSWVALNSKNGHLSTKEKKIKLTGGVNLFYEGGYEMRTDHAYVDTAAGSAYGDTHVEGQGPQGTLEADRFEIKERGQILRFNGSVKMRVYRE